MAEGWMGRDRPEGRDTVDYTCAWERTFDMSLRRLPPWVQRRMTLDGPRRQVGIIDIAAVIQLSQQVERNSRAQSLLETTRIARPKSNITRLAA